MRKAYYTYILLYLLFFVLVICYLAILVVSFLNVKNDKFQEVKSGPAFNMVAELREKAGIKEVIRLYIKEKELITIAFVEQNGEGGKREFKIFTSKVVLETWSEKALRGMFAHELGHVVLKQVESANEKETRADVIAVELAGKDAVSDTLNRIHDSEERKKRLERALEEKR